MNKGWNKYRTLWQAMKGQHFRYIVALAFMFTNIFCLYLIPLVIRCTVDSAIDQKPLAAPAWVQGLVDRVGGMSVVAQNLWMSGLAMLGLAIVAGIAGYLRPRLTNVASETTARRLRDRLYDHLQHLPVSYHDKADAGDLIQRCTSDVEQVRGFMAGQIIDISRAVILVCTGVPIMLWLNPWMAPVALAAIPAVVGFSVVFFTRIRIAFKKVDEAEGAMTTQLQENLTGVRVVRAFARQEFESAKFAERNGRYRDLQRRPHRPHVGLLVQHRLPDDAPDGVGPHARGVLGLDRADARGRPHGVHGVCRHDLVAHPADGPRPDGPLEDDRVAGPPR